MRLVLAQDPPAPPQAPRRAAPARLPLATLGGLLLGLAIAAPADLLAPFFPVAAVLAVLAATLAWRLGWRSFPVGVALALAGVAALHLAVAPAGLLVRAFPDLAALHEALRPRPPAPALPEDVASLQARLLAGTPLPAPRTADGATLNALLAMAGDQRVEAARALARALDTASPRPDALLLHAPLMASGAPGVLEHLPRLPAALSPGARAFLDAKMIADPTERRAALVRLMAAHPGPLPALALAESLAAAALPLAPTQATGRQILALLAGIAAAPPPDFLDPAGAARFAEAVAGLGWVGDITARRAVVSLVAPPPGQRDAPLLLRVTPPETARAVEIRQGEAWVPLATSANDPVPTWRLPRPWRTEILSLRWIDRDGVPSPPFNAPLEPVAAVRASAQRAVMRSDPFALYQPGLVATGRLNSLGIPGHLRIGLSAIEWRTDQDRRTFRQALDLPDAQVLLAEPPRASIDFTVPRGATVLTLVAVLADGTRLPPVDKAIR